MRPAQLILVLLFGGMAIYQEFRNVEVSGLFENFPVSLPFIILSILLLYCLWRNAGQFRKSGNLIAFLPFTMGLLLAGLTLGHYCLRAYRYNLPTVFTAWNPDLGNDGGLWLHFKKGDYLVGQRVDHFSTTTYWGDYSRKGDTIILDLPLDFEMGRRAVVQDKLLRFLDDTVKFEILPF